MPQQSKYSDQQFDALTNDLISVLEKHQASRELSLMALGNIITNILRNQTNAEHRQQMAAKFTEILMKSVTNN
ncbi:DUF1414 domain-containing protein [Bowmanella sp. JS7-9]|uniref:UPF0352 protein ACFP85_09185 n=1 Tax=Pseudobowmanella zhangzhouensis TaxID=1537679 RepID=A0ABW1XK72_9ALTE|nr:DUF1414 domain-containing protein [Bowmanella sp. JS7-9]TBX23206.1 hypothetical protein TK45_08005 [Bowmanella sp. JS7-9]